MDSHENAITEMRARIHFGGGAQFFAYVSPQNNTSEVVTRWSVRIEQLDGNWVGSIDSDNPLQIAQTPKLSGIFKVTVRASGPKFEATTLTPMEDSKSEIGCRSNCAAMIGIVADPGGDGAHYWTVWDAMCG